MLKILLKLVHLMRKYKVRLGVGVILSLTSSILGSIPIIAGAYTIRVILDDINGVNPLDKNYAWQVLAVIIASILARWLVNFIRANVQETIAHEVSTEERLKIGDILKRVSLGFFNKSNLGELNTAVTTDLAFFEIQTMKVFNSIIDSYTFLLLIIICFFSISPAIGITVIIAALGSSVGLYLIEKMSRKTSPIRQKATEDMATEILQYVRGMSIVKSFKQEGVAAKGINQAFKDSKDINTKIEVTYAPLDSIHRFALHAGTTLTIYITALQAINGKIDMAMAIMIIVYAFIMFNSLEGVNTSLHILEIIGNIVNKLETIENAEFIDANGKDLTLYKHDIEFKNVSFGYENKKIIKDLSFKIPEKSTVAIVGPSGGGKSTICRLIARFYDVNQGAIYIGGHNVKEFKGDSLLSNISMVFQNVYLFNDTILNNIKFGNPNASREQIIEAAKLARCHDFISALPNGYDTVVGESGSTLSGGEKQRISIARAILKDAPIVILDEATASIDPENEHYIQEAISALTNGKTIIIIAHRLATIENADKILVISDGKLYEQGNHNELIQNDGIYKRFFNIRQKTEGWSL